MRSAEPASPLSSPTWSPEGVEEETLSSSLQAQQSALRLPRSPRTTSVFPSPRKSEIIVVSLPSSPPPPAMPIRAPPYSHDLVRGGSPSLKSKYFPLPPFLLAPEPKADARLCRFLCTPDPAAFSPAEATTPGRGSRPSRSKAIPLGFSAAEKASARPKVLGFSFPASQ